MHDNVPQLCTPTDGSWHACRSLRAHSGYLSDRHVMQCIKMPRKQKSCLPVAWFARTAAVLSIVAAALTRYHEFRSAATLSAVRLQMQETRVPFRCHFMSLSVLDRKWAMRGICWLLKWRRRGEGSQIGAQQRMVPVGCLCSPSISGRRLRTPTDL